MSGIVGNVGSKSGLVGKTELYYETGTWTPVIKYNANVGGDEAGEFNITWALYTRIGNLVEIELRMVNGGGAPTHSYTMVISGLPFTTQESSYRAIGSAVATNYFNMTVMSDNWADNSLNFVQGTESYYTFSNLTSSSRIAFYGIYQTLDA